MQENGKKNLSMLLLNLILEEKQIWKGKKHQSSNIKRGEMDCLYVKELKRVLCKKDVNQK